MLRRRCASSMFTKNCTFKAASHSFWNDSCRKGYENDHASTNLPLGLIEFILDPRSTGYVRRRNRCVAHTRRHHLAERWGWKTSRPPDQAP